MPDGEPAPPDPGDGARPSGARRPIWRYLNIALHIAIPLIVIALVWHEFSAINLQEVRLAVRRADAAMVALSIAAAGLAICAMGCYDLLAFPTSQRLPARLRWSLSLLFFAWTNFLTLGPIGGPGLRLYVYRKRGLDVGVIIRGILRLYIGLFAGMLSWLVAAVLPLGDGPLPLTMRIAFAIVVAPLASALVSGLLHWVRPSAPPTPGFRTHLVLGLVGVTDWAAGFASFVLAGRAVGVMLPLDDQLRSVFLGHAAGTISMVPAGLGAADAVWLRLQTAAGAERSAATAQVLVFRICFYVVPWLVSLVAIPALLSRRGGAAPPLTGRP